MLAKVVGKIATQQATNTNTEMCVQTAIKTQYFIFMTKNRAVVGFHHNVFVTLIHEPQIAQEKERAAISFFFRKKHFVQQKWVKRGKSALHTPFESNRNDDSDLHSLKKNI